MATRAYDRAWAWTGSEAAVAAAAEAGIELHEGSVFYNIRAREYNGLSEENGELVGPAPFGAKYEALEARTHVIRRQTYVAILTQSSLHDEEFYVWINICSHGPWGNLKYVYTEAEWNARSASGPYGKQGGKQDGKQDGKRGGKKGGKWV